MGVIKRQSFFGTIFMYVGTLLGFLNMAILFPHLLTEAEVGVSRILLSAAMLLAMFFDLGVSTALVRFFPQFENIKQKHNNISSYVLWVSFMGIVLLYFVLWAFKPLIISIFSHKSPLLVQYYYLLFPFTVFFIYFNIFLFYLVAIFETAASTFFREVLLRILVVITVVLYFFKIVNLSQFLACYVAAHGILVLFVLAFIISKKQLFFTYSFRNYSKGLVSEMATYGLFSVLTRANVYFLNTIDTLCIAAFIGEAQAGIYTVSAFFGLMVSMPSQALLTATIPALTKAVRNNDVKFIQDIYQKSTATQLFISGLLLVLLLSNISNIYQFIKPQYASGAWVIVLIACGRIFDIFGGMPNLVISLSNYYKFNVVTNLLLVALSMFTNYIFIPIFGIVGAALATFISLFLHNGLKIVFMYYRYGIHFFSHKIFINLLLIVGVFFIAQLMPIIGPFYVDIVLRSILISVLYIVIGYQLNISLDINIMINNIIRKLGIRK